jgi:hypothetical protein
VRRGLVLLLAALVLAPAASASPRQESVFEDDDLLLHSPTERVESTMSELKQLGVDRIRIPALWRALAPDSEPRDADNPGSYAAARFMSLDRAVESASRHGLSVLLNIRGGAPSWAQGAKRPKALADYDAYRPDPKAFAAFVRMLGRRYDGTFVNADGLELPVVDAWSIWNEPNWSTLLQPQSQNGRPVAPRIYRRLFRAGSRALRATRHGGDVILMGETAPLGASRLGLHYSLFAGRFYRGLFCLTKRLKPSRTRRCRDYAKKGPLKATGVAHHPYPVLAPPEFRSFGADEIRLADGLKLRRIIDAARRYHRVEGRLPIWYTEFGYQTAPPDPYRGVSLARQAAWNVRAELLAYRDPRVLAFDQFLLRDTPPQQEYPASDRRYWSTYQTGLRFDDGRAKPALEAYKLPFMRLKGGRFWGMVRPGVNGVDQLVDIQHRADGDSPWEVLVSHRVTNDRGYFVVRLKKPPAGDYRFVWRGAASRLAVSR